MIKYAKVIERKEGDKINFGSKVKVRTKGREREFEIVGKEESNPEEGKISNISPIGKVLIGKEKEIK
jgi:transcription elongation factor GreA